LQGNSEHQIFDFTETFAELATQNGIENAGKIQEANEEDLKEALKSAGEAAYHWNIGAPTPLKFWAVRWRP